MLRPWQGLVVGAISGAIACLGVPLFDKLKIDDPVSAVTVHGLCGIWVCQVFNCSTVNVTSDLFCCTCNCDYVDFDSFFKLLLS